ncbi:MAG: SpoIVB peptidase S55 domain-containing protein [Coprobacillus sp.]
MLLKRLSIALVVGLSLISQLVSVYAADVYLGGQSIGIELDYEGVMITGTYDISIDNKKYNPSSDGFLSGDLIVKVNQKPISSISLLMDVVEKEIGNSKKINLTLRRNNQEIEKELTIQENDGKFSTGLYVQDGLVGVGTMTYYNPNTQNYGALGHVMSDVSLSSETIVKKGKIFNSYVKNINPSKNGKPGEKIADIGSIEIGTVLDNNSYGIYGHYNDYNNQDQKIVSTASIDEVKEGEAYFLTVLDGHTISKCSIQITDLKNQDKPSIKGITFEITDKKVLSLTNGVVQGMSGSPIIQDGKLIGCVTHVDVNDVHKGYGLYIDWMLENDK